MAKISKWWTLSLGCRKDSTCNILQSGPTAFYMFALRNGSICILQTKNYWVCLYKAIRKMVCYSLKYPST